jgi:RNA 3'-terminal phosphate cyclase
MELTFAPQQIIPGRYHFAVGTAGSSTLVLQTLLPALLTAPTRSELVLEGGTHNPLAPSFDFLEKTFLCRFYIEWAEISRFPLNDRGFIRPAEENFQR